MNWIGPMRWLGPFGFDVLAHPWMLVFLVLVLALLVLELTARPHGVLTISTGETMARVNRHKKAFLRRLPAVLRAAGLALLIVALARPLTGMRPRVEAVDIRDIVLCVDVSGSMTADDFIVGDKRRNRLWVTKEAVRHFINSRKLHREDRFGADRVGLVLYAAHAWMQCPLTLDYGVLERELDALEIDKDDQKSHRTAIGSAIGLAISKLDKSEAKSKVIILVTDGINNHGNLDPITAAQVASDFGIRVYTIGAGSTDGGRVMRDTMLGPIVRPAGDPIDEASLQRIASISGAKYYRAVDMESLTGAYQEINELETTEVKIGDVYDYSDGFMPWALLGTVATTASIFVRRRWFEAIP